MKYIDAVIACIYSKSLSETSCLTSHSGLLSTKKEETAFTISLFRFIQILLSERTIKFRSGQSR